MLLHKRPRQSFNDAMMAGAAMLQRRFPRVARHASRAFHGAAVVGVLATGYVLGSKIVDYFKDLRLWLHQQPAEHHELIKLFAMHGKGTAQAALIFCTNYMICKHCMALLINDAPDIYKNHRMKQVMSGLSGGLIMIGGVAWEGLQSTVNIAPYDFKDLAGYAVGVGVPCAITLYRNRRPGSCEHRVPVAA